MMNTIQIKFGSFNNGLVTIGHNQQILYKNTIVDQISTFEVKCDNFENKFWLFLDSSATDNICLDWITMFDLGKESLIYLGILKTLDNSYQSQIIKPNSTWILKYKYPVFTWLHQTLNHGWLVKHH